ncbi:MAG TPA: hypothetical protein VMS92_17715, partial [Mycobacterium sp.]|nr:hypothetical protein [Mycobacterium sp.]
TMENAKHIGGIWALAVALGVGMAVASSPAVASAKPADSDQGASHDSGSTSSDKPSAKTATSAPSDPDSRHPRPRKPKGAVNVATTPATADAPDTDAPRSRRGSAHQASVNTSKKTSPKAAIDAAVADPAVHERSMDVTRPAAAVTMAPVHSTAAPAVKARGPASTFGTPPPADPVSRLVTTVINAVLSPFAGSAPSAPVHTPAGFTLMAFARREFEPAATVDQPAAAVSTSAVDPGFISSTHDIFGLFSITSAADPDDNHYVAFVIRTPFFTNVLTSGTDPEDNLGFGPASIGVAGQTVNTFISPFLNFSIALPFEDPFAELFTELVRLGF